MECHLEGTAPPTEPNYHSSSAAPTEIPDAANYEPLPLPGPSTGSEFKRAFIRPQEENAAIRAVAEQLKSENETQRDTFKQSLDKLHEAQTLYQRDRETLQTERDKARADLKELKRQLDQATVEQDALQRERDHAKIDRGVMQRERDQLRSDHKHLEDDRDALLREHDEVKREPPGGEIWRSGGYMATMQ